MNEQEVLEALQDHGAIQEGHFKLSSGLHSNVYVQCALALQWPGLAERFGHEIGRCFAGSSAHAVLGPAMGGLIIGHETARVLGARMVFCERAGGEMTLRRGFGFAPGERVLIVEDVVSTGRSQKEAIALAQSHGAEVVGVGAIVDRFSGATFGVQFAALAQLHDKRWSSAQCPLCAAGEPMSAPGSRHLTSGNAGT